MYSLTFVPHLGPILILMAFSLRYPIVRIAYLKDCRPDRPVPYRPVPSRPVLNIFQKLTNAIFLKNCASENWPTADPYPFRTDGPTRTVQYRRTDPYRSEKIEKILIQQGPLDYRAPCRRVRPLIESTTRPLRQNGYAVDTSPSQ